MNFDHCSNLIKTIKSSPSAVFISSQEHISWDSCDPHYSNSGAPMESSQEISPAPSTSSKGFTAALSKTRIGRKNDPPSTWTNDADDRTDRTSVRNSVDSLLDIARSTRGGSTDDGLPLGPSKLSKLIPGRAEKKRRKREEAEQAQKDAEDGRGRSADNHTATAAIANQLTGNKSPSRSRSSLGDGEASLITFDSDTES